MCTKVHFSVDFYFSAVLSVIFNVEKQKISILVEKKAYWLISMLQMVHT